MNKFKHKKKYGQNFLKDDNVVKSIISNANLTEEDTVVEIGPGKGVLTSFLSCVCKNVIAYEIDDDLRDILDNLSRKCKNVKIKWGDFMQVCLEKELSGINNVSVIANIPYYITTPIILKLTDSKICFKQIILMVQKEVGMRLAASSGCSEYGSITAYLNYFYDIEKLFIVKREEFEPVPKVDSMLIKLVPKKERSFVKDEVKLFNLLDDSFKYKRKTLKNNLKAYDFNKVMDILKKRGFDDNVRAEELSIDDFVCIVNNL